MIVFIHRRRVWFELTPFDWNLWPIVQRGHGALSLATKLGTILSVWFGPIRFYKFDPEVPPPEPAADE